jgi:hypothetical protein
MKASRSADQYMGFLHSGTVQMLVREAYFLGRSWVETISVRGWANLITRGYDWP